jgi:hypothetical protein
MSWVQLVFRGKFEGVMVYRATCPSAPPVGDPSVFPVPSVGHPLQYFPQRTQRTRSKNLIPPAGKTAILTKQFTVTMLKTCLFF